MKCNCFLFHCNHNKQSLLYRFIHYIDTKLELDLLDPLQCQNKAFGYCITFEGGERVFYYYCDKCAKEHGEIYNFISINKISKESFDLLKVLE